MPDTFNSHAALPEPRPSDSDCFDEVDLAELSGAVSYYMRMLTRWVSRDLERKLGALPVARGTGKITTLYLIKNHPGISASKIVEFTSKDAPAMTRMIDKMVEDGLIRRFADPEQRRRQKLEITEYGEEVLSRVREIVRAEREDIFWMLDDAEHAEVVRLLRKIANAQVEQARGRSGIRRQS